MTEIPSISNLDIINILKSNDDEENVYFKMNAADKMIVYLGKFNFSLE